MNTSEKVCVVAGCTSSIGRDSCIFMSKNGYAIAAIDHNDQKGMDIVDEINRNGGKANFWHFDFVSDGNIRKTFSEIYNTFGEINLVITTSKDMNKEDGSENSSPKTVKQNFFEKLENRLNCSEYLFPFMSKDSCNTVVNICTI